MKIGPYIFALDDPIYSKQLPDQEADNGSKFGSAHVAGIHFLFHRSIPAITNEAIAKSKSPKGKRKDTC